MSKFLRRGFLFATLLAAFVIVLWKVEVKREDASRSVAEREIEARAEAELVEPAADPAAAELAPPEQEPERTANLATEPEPLVETVSAGIKAPFSVRAFCVDESGDALEGVSLTVVSLADCPIAYSDATGLAQLEFDRELERVGLPIPALKSAGAPTALQLSKAGRTTRIVYVAPIEELEHHDCGRVELSPAGTVVGRVVGSDGLPIVGALVLPAPPVPELTEDEARQLRVSGLFWRSLEFGGAATTTDFDGRFRVEGMSTEPACLWTQHAGTYAAWTEPLALKPSELVDVGTLTLETLAPKDRIAGRVLNVDGTPCAGAMVSCESATDIAMGPRTLVQSDANGRFLVPALAGVTHRLLAHHPSEASSTARLGDVLGGTLDVVLQFEKPEASPAKEGTVLGVVLQGGEPGRHAILQSFLYRDSSGVPIVWRTHRADSEGRFALELPLGRMRLQARSHGGAAVGMSNEYTVAATPPTEELVIGLEPVAAIEGLVLAPPGAEASGLEFRATGPFGLTHKTSTRSDGSFEFENLQPGSWTVQRISTPLFTSGDHSPVGTEQRELVLAAGDVVRLEFDLRTSAQLEGRIAIGDQDYSAWIWSVAGVQGKFGAGGVFRIPAIAQLGETQLAFGGRLAHSTVQVTSDVRLEAGLNRWSFEVATGRVELRGLPLESEFPRDGSFAPVCCLYYEHSEGTVWEAMPFTAQSGTRVIEHVPVGRVLVVRGGIGAAAELSQWPEAPVGQVLAELEVRAGETATFEWRE